MTIRNKDRSAFCSDKNRGWYGIVRYRKDTGEDPNQPTCGSPEKPYVFRDLPIGCYYNFLFGVRYSREAVCIEYRNPSDAYTCERAAFDFKLEPAQFNHFIDPNSGTYLRNSGVNWNLGSRIPTQYFATNRSTGVVLDVRAGTNYTITTNENYGAVDYIDVKDHFVNFRIPGWAYSSFYIPRVAEFLIGMFEDHPFFRTFYGFPYSIRAPMMRANIFCENGRTIEEIPVEELCQDNPDDGGSNTSDDIERYTPLNDECYYHNWIYNGGSQFISTVGSKIFPIQQLSGYRIVSAETKFCGCGKDECECGDCCANKYHILKLLGTKLNAQI